MMGATLCCYALWSGTSTREDFLSTSLALLICAAMASLFLLSETKQETVTSGWRALDRGLLKLAAIAFLGLFAEGAMAD